MKKKIVMAAMAAMVTLTGCETLQIPYLNYSNVLDYTEYTEQGFFVSEAPSVSFSYQPVGSVMVVVQSGAQVKSSKKVMKDEVYGQTGQGVKQSYGPYKAATLSDGMRTMVNAAKKAGANGLINVKSEFHASTTASSEFIYMTGMAIKK